MVVGVEEDFELRKFAIEVVNDLRFEFVAGAGKGADGERWGRWSSPMCLETGREPG